MGCVLRVLAIGITLATAFVAKPANAATCTYPQKSCGIKCIPFGDVCCPYGTGGLQSFACPDGSGCCGAVCMAAGRRCCMKSNGWSCPAGYTCNATKSTCEPPGTGGGGGGGSTGGSCAAGTVPCGAGCIEAGLVCCETYACGASQVCGANKTCLTSGTGSSSPAPSPAPTSPFGCSAVGGGVSLAWGLLAPLSALARARRRRAAPMLRIGLVAALVVLALPQDALGMDSRGKLPSTLRDGWLLAQAEKVDVIKTRDGRVHTGQVLNELRSGYLFRPAAGGAAYVVSFDEIEDLQLSTAGAPPSGSPQPAVDPAPPGRAPPPSLRPSPPTAVTSQARLLEAELAELKGSSASLGSPIGMIVVGLGSTILCVLFAGGLFGSTSATIALTIVAGLAAGVFTIAGVVGLIRGIMSNVARNRRIDEIDGELLQLRQSFAPAGGPGFATWASPRPSVLLARF